MPSLEFQVWLLSWSIPFEPEELLRGDERIGVRTRRAGDVIEGAGDGGRGLQIEAGVGPGSTGDPPATRLCRPAIRRTVRDQVSGPGERTVVCNVAHRRSGRRALDIFCTSHGARQRW